MQNSNIPAKFPLVWGASAGPSYVNAIPPASQIGIAAGRASLADGFPPLNFTPVGSGGVPPFGADMNGILKQITAWQQWQQAGGPVAYDAAFQAAVGGYPQGAIVGSANVFGLQWLCTIDNNTSNPDLGGAGWVRYSPTILSANANYYVNASTGSDASGKGTAASPWQTLQMAWNYLQNNVNLNGYVATINCTGNFTAGVLAGGPILGGSGTTTSASVMFSFTSGSTVAVTNASCFQATNGAVFQIQAAGTAVVLSTTGSLVGAGTAIACFTGSTIFIGSGLNFGACYGGHINTNGGTVAVQKGYTISGGALSHFATLEAGGAILLPQQSPAQTITLIGTPAFTIFAFLTQLGSLVSNSAYTLFSGSATGQRYSIQSNSVCSTGGGASYFPGIAGSTASGGQYL